MKPEQKKGLLMTLWIFVTVNYLYCDIVSLMDSQMLRQYLSGSVGTIQMTQNFLLGASILMEIPIAMILLSRTLPHRSNRWANITAGTIMTLVQFASLFTAVPTLYYIFFSVIEIACTVGIAAIAISWVSDQTLPASR